MGDYPHNFLINFYFLKSVNESENEVLINMNDFFEFQKIINIIRIFRIKF